MSAFFHNKFWKEVSYMRQDPRILRLRCPRCGKIYIMPKQWGVWKGCPICWIKLEYKKGKEK